MPAAVTVELRYCAVFGKNSPERARSFRRRGLVEIAKKWRTEYLDALKMSECLKILLAASKRRF